MSKISALRNFLTLCLIIVMASCSSPDKKESSVDSDSQGPVITIEDTRFVDSHGRQLMLNGINLVNKNSNENYIGPEGEETFRNFKNWGFNVIRLGIIWDGLEPEPGVYDEAYLKKIDHQVEMAAENGLMVFLDMHQDLYSVKYSDGAPEWATLDEGKPHVKGAVWSDAYLISPAVQTSWDNFWKNSPVEDGLGVQDHYANAWQHVAKRYKDNKTVIGYDIMNEPFAGSEAQAYMPILFTAFAQLISEEGGDEISVQEVAAMWSDTKGRYMALQKISSKEKFSRVMDAVYDMNAAFEKGPLQKFYQKVTDAVREIDKSKILFFNHSYFCNSGVSTALEPMKGKDGQTDPLVVYAAHGYDLLVDTDELSNSSDDRLELIFERIYESGKRMNIPVLIGEWGALGGNQPGRTELAHKNLRIFEKYHFNNTYWAYGLGTENYPYFMKGVVRPYPSAIAGTLISYQYDPSNGQFTLSWNESADIKAPTRIYVPSLKDISNESIELSPNMDGLELEPLEGADGGYVSIQPMEKDQVRKVSFQYEMEHAEDISLKSKN